MEFWFDYASIYSYPAVMRVHRECALFEQNLVWKPFLLGPFFKSVGFENAPFVVNEKKGAYVWIDIKRECAKYGLTWNKPSHFPRNSVLAARVALVGIAEGWIEPFSREIMQRNFAQDRNIGAREEMIAALEALKLPAIEILHRASATETKALLRSNTEEAMKKGIFGAPMFISRGEMFWGNDKLVDALQFAKCGQLAPID